MIPLYLYYRIKQEREAANAMQDQAEPVQEAEAPTRVSTFSRFRALAGAIGRTAASAGSLLADPDLRGQARALVGKQAGQSFSTIKEGVQYETEYITQRINNGLGYVQQGPRHVQAVLTRLQKRIEETRLQALLEAERDAPVDVQIGPQLVEEAPQELRSRLWLALIDNPQLCHTYDEGKVEPARRTSSPGTPAHSQHSKASIKPHDDFVTVSSAPTSLDTTNSQHSNQAASSSSGQLPDGPQAASQSTGQSSTSPARSELKTERQTNATGSAQTGNSTADVQPDVSDPFQESLNALQEEKQQSAHQAEASLQPKAGLDSHQQSGQRQSGSDSQQQQEVTPQSASDALKPSTSGKSSLHAPSVSSSAAAGVSNGPEAGSEGVNASPVGSASTDAWEMVQDANNIYNWKAGSLFGRSLSSSRRQGSECSEEGESYSQCLMNAVMAVEWPITVEFSEASRYNTLLQISVGQEEVDEVIGRDINRTFPEHPQFGFEQGQQALYRVLKAYSLHDLEVGYCQGMAFVAGVILMYLPEEPAFRVLCQLLDEGGVGLRTLYLPGLSGLKEELRMLDWLMERLMPNLKQHLEDYGAVPVLYASQWFLTIFSCPFPATFSCRVIDVMLTENSSNIFLRAALAVLAECEEDLMKLDDFEDLITYLKVQPVQWDAAHTRLVLSSAISSPSPLCSPPMIEAARLAVQEGYEGTMHRRASSMSEVAAAVTEAATAGVISSTAPLSSSNHSASDQMSASTSSVDAQKEDAQPDATVSTNGIESATAKLSRQSLSMDDGQLAMRLALDVLWTGSGSGAAQPSEQDAAAQQSESNNVSAES